MLEKRRARRRRVCLQGSVTSGLTGEVIPVQIRNVSEAGAQIRLATGSLSSREIAFRVDRTGEVQEAEVIWRSMELYGLRFRTAEAHQPGSVTAEPGCLAGAAGSTLAQWLEKQPTP